MNAPHKGGRTPVFPPNLEAINYEQLEAEFHAGCAVVMYPTVSLTTLAHLVMAAQYAMLAPTITAPSFAVLNAFVNEALASAPFPPETLKLIQAAMPKPREKRDTDSKQP